MKKIIKFVVAFSILIVGALVAYHYLGGQSPAENQNYQKAYAVKATPATYENIEDVLSGNDMIKMLPENSIISLKFYNFNTGSRVWEKSYILKKGYAKELKEGITKDINLDITLSMHSKYLNELTDQNLCSIIRKAKSNNDLGIEMHISYAALLWKYRTVLKYKDCFGL